MPLLGCLLHLVGETGEPQIASFTGLVAENIVGTMGILYSQGRDEDIRCTGSELYAGNRLFILVFNLLCAPCFAAIGATKREMNSHKWTWFAVGYQTGFAYLISLMINQFGRLFNGSPDIIGLIFAIAVLAFMLYMLLDHIKEATKLETHS